MTRAQEILVEITASKLEIDILEIIDIEQLYPLGYEFAQESKGSFSFKEDVFKRNWKQFYNDGKGIILKAHKDGEIVGMFGFIFYEDILNGDLCATETFWYMKKEHRGGGLRLLERFEEISKELGVKKVCMIHLSRLMPEKLKSIYTKRGYTEIETHFTKEFR